MRLIAVAALLLSFFVTAAAIHALAYGGSVSMSVSTTNITQYIYVITTYAIPEHIIFNITEGVVTYQTSYQSNVTTILTVKLVYVGAVGLVIIAPSYVTVCDLPYRYVVTIFYTNGTPAAWLMTCIKTDWNYTACTYTSGTGQATFYLYPPSYGVWHVNVTISNVTVWTTTLRYLNCLFATTTTPSLPPSYVPPGPLIVVNYTNVTVSWNPGGIAFPSLTSPLGIVIAGALVAIWAWLARIDIGYATIVIGYVLAALGAVYDNAALVTGGALAMVGGFILRRVKTS